MSSREGRDKTGRAPSDATLIAGRYRLDSLLGSGGHGDVWEARDVVLGETVAVKLLRCTEAEASRARREISTLRILRLPGVVRLLDEGTIAGRPFLVMERVRGLPFPGRAQEPEPEDSAEASIPVGTPGMTADLTLDGTQSCDVPRSTGSALAPGTMLKDRRARWTWLALADRAEALLEIIGRVHAAGVIHRDLKPANVLVSDEGRLTVLDFGLSFGAGRDQQRTEQGQILGTPAYLAPEQARTGEIDERADLYAVGVMFYEALAGRRPHELTGLAALLVARLVEPSPPILDLAPDLPPAVAGLIDRMLAIHPEDRPRSALEALSLLRGQPTVRRVSFLMPRLGGDAPVRAVIDSARAGHSIDIVGPTGSGRSRCLEDACEALAREGRRVVQTLRGHDRLESLKPLLGSLDDYPGKGVRETLEVAEEQLRAALRGGLVLAADDAGELDAWSAAAIERARCEGAVLRVLPEERAAEGSVRLEPLSEEALIPLFRGPDRLLHLREDAARILFTRTCGLPAHVVVEIEAWARAGLVRWDGSSFVTDRYTLDRLASGLEVTSLPQRLALISTDLKANELLQWLTLAGHALGPEQLAWLTGRALWQVEAELERLWTRGAVRRVPNGRIEAQGSVELDWPYEQRREAHRAIAATLGASEEGRLLHLLAAEERDLVATEAVALSTRLAEEGKLGQAATALQEGLLAVRRWSPDVVHPSEEMLLARSIQLAFAERTESALDQTLYEVCRTAARNPLSPGVARLKGLLEAGLAALSPHGRHSLAMADALPPFHDQELERWRHWIRIRGVNRASPEVLSAAVLPAQEWAERSDSSLAKASLAGWLGILRYGQGRFDEAAQLHAEAAEGEPWLVDRIASILNGASALLEAFRHREAATRASAALPLAARCRHAYFEGRAEWIIRAAMYRTGALKEIDPEFVDGIKAVGAPELEALVCINEAAIAWRAGDAAKSAELASRAAWIWKGGERPWPELLARCLAARSETTAESELRDLAERAARCPVPGVGIQALGLLGLAFPWIRPLPQTLLDTLCEGIPKDHWDRRMDVISVDEALVWAGASRS